MLIVILIEGQVGFTWLQKNQEKGGFFMVVLLFISVIPDSVSFERVKGIFEASLMRNKGVEIENPADFFYYKFETFHPFWWYIGARYLKVHGYSKKDEYPSTADLRNAIARANKMAQFLWDYFRWSSEVIIGEVMERHVDTVDLHCELGRVFKIRVDTVLMGELEPGDVITTNAPGGWTIRMSPDYSDYPYINGDTVLVFLTHFPLKLHCHSLWKEHRLDIGYKMPFYEVISMFRVGTLYFEPRIHRGPLHVSFHKKTGRNYRFDYPYDDVLVFLEEVIRWGKEVQNKFYGFITESRMDSIITGRLKRKDIIRRICR